MISVTHMLLELFECNAPISDLDFVERALDGAVHRAELTPLHRFFHRFEPQGVTGIVVLQESHISIHTWPEDSYAVVAFLTCGPRKKGIEACRFLEQHLQATDTKLTETPSSNLSRLDPLYGRKFPQPRR